jgi:hypothetical protein
MVRAMIEPARENALVTANDFGGRIGLASLGAGYVR